MLNKLSKFIEQELVYYQGEIVKMTKTPKWAQKVAFKIWRDAEKNGFPTKKGVKDIVKGLWATIIYEGSKKRG